MLCETRAFVSIITILLQKVQFSALLFILHPAKLPAGFCFKRRGIETGDIPIQSHSFFLHFHRSPNIQEPVIII